MENLPDELMDIDTEQQTIDNERERERRALARPPRQGIREDPGRNQLCTVSVYPDA